MIVDNSSVIRNLLKFPPEISNKDFFYVVQLIQRSKDKPKKVYNNSNSRNNSNKSLWQTYIYSIKDYDDKIPLIIDLAKTLQARAYINLNLKSSYNAFVNLVKNIGCRLETNNYKHLSRIYNEAVGEIKGNVIFGDRWIVDYDGLKMSTDLLTGINDNRLLNITKYITSLRGGGKNGNGEILGLIETLNGIHLITTSFDLESFRKRYKKMDVHKDNPTILWASNEWR